MTDAVLEGVGLVHLGSDGSVFTLEADDNTPQRDASLSPVSPIGPGASFSAFAADAQLVFGLPPGAAFGDAPSVWRPGRTEPVLPLPDGI